MILLLFVATTSVWYVWLVIMAWRSSVGKRFYVIICVFGSLARCIRTHHPFYWQHIRHSGVFFYYNFCFCFFLLTSLWERWAGSLTSNDDWLKRPASLSIELCVTLLRENTVPPSSLIPFRTKDNLLKTYHDHDEDADECINCFVKQYVPYFFLVFYPLLRKYPHNITSSPLIVVVIWFSFLSEVDSDQQ